MTGPWTGIRPFTHKAAIFPVFLLAVVGSCTSGEEPGSIPATAPLANIGCWAYQIQSQHEGDALDRLAESHYDLLVIDQPRSIKGEEDHDSRADVSRLKSGPNTSEGDRIVVAYIDVGEAESYRWYWQPGWRVGSPEWIVAPDPEGWDENYPVQFWRPEWKSVVTEYFDRIIDDGYDGAYLDWLEAYSFEPVAEAARSQGLDPERELIEFVGDLAEHARSRDPGFLLIAQNGAELGERPEYVDLFDGIAQEAIWYDGAGDPDVGDEPGDFPLDPEDSEEYLDDLRLWQDAGVPVLNVEYAQDEDNARRAYRLGRENGFVTYVTLRPLDSLTDTPPPGY
jgi:cysteinyl-tRNA synthetase